MTNTLPEPTQEPQYPSGNLKLILAVDLDTFSHDNFEWACVVHDTWIIEMAAGVLKQAKPHERTFTKWT